MLAQGFEEIEAMTVVDVLRRANITCDMVGFEEQVTGSHAIQVRADRVFEGDLSDYDMIVLPGGMPGSAHLRDNQALIQELQSFEQKGKKLAAICAAPIALNQAGPSTALAFAYELVEQLGGDAESLRTGMLYRDVFGKNQ
ncbi:MAG: DJ-1/PfpI family protein [Streptococcus mitis]|nr:DJ-1/PfpI family protein [Streptococcus mitis]